MLNFINKIEVHISFCLCLLLSYQEDCAPLNILENLKLFQAAELECSSQTSALRLGEIWA